MTKSRKVVAIVLAFLMIFSSASVLASAWDAAVDDGFALDITTEFYKQVNGEWVATSKVRPGDTVKARVWLGTDYYSNDSTLLFFYDNTFFTTAYGTSEPLEVNTDAASFAALNDLSGQFVTSSSTLEAQLAGDCGLNAAFLAANDYFYVNTNFLSQNNIMYDDSSWLFEFTMTVAPGASGEAELFVVPATIQNSTTQANAVVSVPKGEAAGTLATVWPMWFWDANTTLVANPVSTQSSVTFNANGGAFDAADTETYLVEGAIDAAIVAADIPAISRSGYTFMGWIDAADATPTLAEVIAAPATIPEDDLELNAFWLDNVDITFDSVDGSAVASHLDVTPYTTFAAVANPTKAGYTFMGWSTDGTTVAALPATYPDVDTEYIAVWALDVTVSFNTDGAAPIAPIVGAAGTPFTESIANPSKQGYYFVTWDPSLPTVFPAQDTTYNAIFEPYIYTVNYYVDGALVANGVVRYGDEIPVSLPNLNIPNGYQASDWYTDSAFNTPLAAGATMGTADINLYAYTELRNYDAIFMVEGTEHARVNTPYGATIVAPADPSRVGYTFTGWSPSVGDMDVAADKYFYATWVQNVYTVSYYTDGELYQVYDIANGDELDVPADPEKTGYTFIGWDDSAEATTPITLPQYMLTDTAEYYAVFTVNQYDAVFNTNDGAFDDLETSKTVSTDFGAVPVAPGVPVRTGYTFAGWTPELSEMTEDGATYEATWTANAKTYNVAVYLMGTDGLYATEPDDTLTFNAVSDEEVSYTHTAMTGFTPDIANSTLTGTVPADNTTLTLVARYTRNQYTFTTDDDFGTTASEQYYFDEAVAEPTAPVQNGYTFIGWNDAENNAITFPMNMPAAAFTATAEWEAIDYNVTYTYTNTPDYGTAPALPEATTANIGDAMTVAAAPTLTGYTFSGWTTDDVTVAANAYEMPANAVAFTGTWTAKDYTITYSYETTPAGATALPANVTDANIGDEVALNAPTAPGYTFNGWVVTGELDDAATAAGFTVGAENITVVGSWTANDYNVTYSYETTPAGATALPANITDANIGDEIALNAPTAPGYTFDGWVVTGAASQTAAAFTVGTSDITVVGSWTAVDYTINYSYTGVVPAGATALPANVTDANIGDVIALNAPTAPGYTFDGWVVTGAASQTAEDFTMGAGDVTVVGSWSANSFNATFNANGGEFEGGATSVDVLTAFDAIPVAPAAPTRVGYTFTGWTPTLNVMDTVGGETYTAVWEAKNYGATFNANGGVFEGGLEQVIVPTAFDATPVAPTAPTRVGFVFGGWTPAINVMDTVGGETYTAIWNAATDTPYIINTYTMGTDGEYGEAAVQNLAGTTGAAVDATPTVATGFTLNTAASHLTDTIAADGSTVLNVYIDRNEYTFTTNVDGVTTDVDYYYEAAIATPAVPTKPGYTFAAWTASVPATMPAEAVTVTATWTANTDTAFTVAITYYNNISSANVTATQAFTGTTGYAIEIVETMPAVPAADTKYILYSELRAIANYTLDAANAGNEFTGKSIAADGSTVVNVVYEAVEFDLTYNDAEGGVFETITQAYGTIITPPATTPVKYGYTFAAWNPVITANTRAYGARTYEPTYNANNYDARFFTNVGDTTAYYTYSVAFDDNIIAPAGANVPVKQGYTFVKWVDADNADVTFPTTMNSEDGRDFYAVWTPALVDYTVNTYVMDNTGAYPETPVAEVLQGYTEATATTAPAARTGFTLDTDASTLSATIAADGSTVLSVYFSRNQYTITTDVDGATTDYTDYYEAPLTIADPAKTGYTFAGWVDADAAATTIPAAIPAESYTVTATWAPALVNYTVNTYVMDTEGNYPADPTAEVLQGYTEATATTAPAARTGFTLDTAASTLSATIAADGSTVLSVYFSRNQYTITTVANNNNGNTTNEYTFYYLEEVTGIPNPTRTGYSFVSWDPALPVNMLADDSTVTATWTPVLVDYTVNTYVMDTEGNYPATPTAEVLQGYTEATATTTPAARTGFTLDTEASTLSDTIVYDGSTVLSVYFSRNQYTITTDVDGATTDYTGYYEAALTIADPSKAGYTFAGWVDADDAEATIPASFPAESYTVTATWDAIDYSITYSYTNTPDYGTAPALPETTTTNNIGDIVAIADAPTLAGYTFSGWTVSGAAETTATTLTMGAGDVTVTGSWTAIPYTVSYEYTNAPAFGTAPALPEDVTVNIGDEMTVAAVPTLTGYTFTGWTTEDVTVSANAYTVPAGDVTFTGTWTAIPYTVSYEYTNAPDFGTAPALPEATTANIGDAMTVAAAPTLAGYTFSGWTTDDATVAANAYEMPANAVAFTGTWTAKDYTITYSYETTPAGATALPANVTDANIGDEVALNAPTAPGYTFNGWVVTGELNNAATAAGFTVGAENITVVGSWTANDYNVTYSYETTPAGATALPANITDANIGDEIALNAPTAPGYTFDGWVVTGAASQTAAAFTVGTSDITVVGSWTAIDYTITYSYTGVVPAGATALPANVTDANIGDVIAFNAPTATGYTFNGWVVTGAASQTAASFTMGAANVTVVGSWTANSFNATFNANGGEFEGGATSVNVPTAFDATPVAPADPSRVGYTFAGWTPTINVMDTVGGETYTAVWTANIYNATFNANGGEFEGGATSVDVPTAFDATPVAPTAPTRVGFIFNGWTPTINAMDTVGGETYTANWAPDTATAYTVVTRTMDTAGEYVEESETFYGTTGDAIDATPTVAAGFTLNTAASTLTGNISALGDTVLTVVIDRNEYDFAVDNTNGDEIITTTYYYGAAVTDPATPAKTGYTFAGWTPAVPETMPAEDYDVAATWTANNYNATFNSNLGTFEGGLTTINVPTAFDATPVAPADPSRAGYTFAGWTPAINVMDTVGGETYEATWTANAQDYTVSVYTMRADGTYAPAVVSTVTGEAVTDDTVTLVAGEDYTVGTGFELNTETSTLTGTIPATGTLNLNVYIDRSIFTVTTTVEGEEATYDFRFGESVTGIPDPTKTGYEFTGWTPELPDTMPAEAVAVTATFAPVAVTYTVNYYYMNLAGAYPATPDSTDATGTATADASFTFAPAAVEGFTLDAAASTLTQVVAANGTTEYEVYYSRNQYVFTVNNDNGDALINTTYYYGATVAAPTEPTKVGYTFGSWAPAVPATMPAEAVTVVAQWNINSYDVSFFFDADATEALNTTAVEYNANIAEYTHQTQTGYTFQGWALRGTTDVLTFPQTMGAADVEYVGIWTVNSYTATFRSLGQVFDTQSVDFGSNIVLPDPAPERTGYTFLGWSLQGSTEVLTFPQVMGAEDVNYVAQWQINTYTITYYVDNVLTETVANQNYNTLLTLIAEPTKTGYTFSGWSTDDATLAANQFRVPANDVRIDGTFDANSYDVTFNAGEGTFESNGLATLVVPVDFDATLAVPEQPVRAGYTFTGWVDAENAAVTLPMTMTTADDITLTATWSADAKTYYVDIYEMTTDGTYEATADRTLDFASVTDAAVSYTAPAMTGFTVDATSVLEGTVPATGELRLVLKYSRNQYTITITVDGIDDETTDYFGAAYVAPADPEKEGYTFAGWVDAENNAVAIPATIPAEDFTAIASWTINSYEVTWNVDGTETVDAYDFGEAIVLPETPTKVGYTFNSWTPTVAATMPAEDVTYTAVWDINFYDVTYNANGGWFDGDTAITTKTFTSVDYGTTIPAPALNPERTGYTFGSWSPATTVMPDEAVDFTAQWIPNGATPYTVVTRTMDTAGVYVEGTETLYGTTGTAVDATPTVADGFTLNTASSTLTGNISALGDTVLTVVLDRNQYTVSFDGEETTMYYGATIVAPTPTRTGYDFEGWTPEVAATVPLEGASYTSNWTILSFDITYYVDDVLTYTDTYDYNEAVTARADEVRAGYTFSGWSAIPANMPANDVRVNGSFTADLHTATFNAAGGYFDGITTITSKQVTAYCDAAFTAPADPERDGYTFNGWDTEIPATMTPVDVTYTAQWLINNYDVTYYVDGEVYQTVADQDYATELTTIAQPTRTGYTFSNWTSEDVIIEDNAFTVPANDVRIDGTFTANSYNVTFDAGVGTFESNGEATLVVPIDFDSDIAIPENEVPVRTGYTFAGWVDADSQAVTLPVTMTTADAITLTATWTADAKTYYVDVYEMTTDGTYAATADRTLDFTSETDAAVSYTAPEIAGFTVDAASVLTGTVPATGALRLVLKYSRNQYTFNVTVDDVLTETTTTYHGAAITAPATPVKTGYTFAAWVDGEDAIVTIPATMPIGGLDVYASWDINSYTVTWNVDGAETEDTYDYNEAIVAPADPVKTGYTFRGWTPEIPATMPAEDLTFTAEFEKNINTVNYYIDGTLMAFNGLEYGTVIGTGLNYTVPAGYSLNGWYTDSTFETAFVAGTTMGTEDVNLYAYTSANTYDAEFYVDNVLANTVPTAFGEIIVAPADPTKAGFTFTGWSPEVGEMDAEGKRFDATFAPAALTETFIVDGENYEVFYVNSGDEFDVPADPDKEGYTFSGWSLTDGGAVVALPATMGTANTTYYAIFAVNSYTLTYFVDDVQDGLVETYEFGAAITARTEPTQTGYAFSGWTPAVPATMPANDVEIRGTFTVNSYDAVFTADDADTPYTETVAYDYGTAITAPEVTLTRDGFDFSGWALASAPDTVLEDLGTMDENGKEFVAVWTASAPSTFTVNFYDYVASDHGPAADSTRNATPIASYEVALNGEIPFPEDPAFANYTFAGWTDADGEGGTAYAAGATLTTNGLNLYSHYDRVEVKLIKATGTNTVITRSTNAANCIVSGLTVGRGVTIATLRAAVAVQGDGTISYTKSEIAVGNTYGTGAKITVTDNVTGEVVESFYVVVYGDVNGDGRITALDVAQLKAEISGTRVWSAPRAGATQVFYRFTAANINGDRQVSALDFARFKNVVAGTATINQVTGVAA